jgi:hypothetical protein
MCPPSFDAKFRKTKNIITCTLKFPIHRPAKISATQDSHVFQTSVYQILPINVEKNEKLGRKIVISPITAHCPFDIKVRGRLATYT